MFIYLAVFINRFVLSIYPQILFASTRYQIHVVIALQYIVNVELQ